jgi:hypothetical protein
VFNFPRKDDTAEMMWADFDVARAKWINGAATPAERVELERSSILAYLDYAGQQADFHSLRHKFISNLDRAAVHPKPMPSGKSGLLIRSRCSRLLSGTRLLLNSNHITREHRQPGFDLFFTCPAVLPARLPESVGLN